MSFHRTRKVIILRYCLGGQPLERVNQIKDLEFLYVPSLDFQPHIDITSLVKLYMYSVLSNDTHRILIPSNVFMRFYSPVVRAVLLYGAVFWSPYTKEDIRRVDKSPELVPKLCRVLFKYSSPSQRLQTYNGGVWFTRFTIHYLLDAGFSVIVLFWVY